MKPIFVFLIFLLATSTFAAEMIGGDFYVVSDYASDTTWPNAGGYTGAENVDNVEDCETTEAGSRDVPQSLQYPAQIMPGVPIDLLSCAPQGTMLIHIYPTNWCIVILCAPAQPAASNIECLTGAYSQTPDIQMVVKGPGPSSGMELIGQTTKGGLSGKQGQNTQSIIPVTSAEIDTDVAVALFQRDRPLGTDVYPLAEWAKLLAIPQSLGVPNVEAERGNPASLSSAFRALSSHVQNSGAEIESTEVALIQERLNRICAFLDNCAGQSKNLDPRRLTAVCLALSQIGQVEAHRSVSEPGSNRSHRYGWRRLREYFRVSFDGKMWPALENQIKYSKAKYPPHWCGIFCWWALKVAGYELPPWPTGVGIYGSVPQRAQKSDSQPGDIAFHGGKNGHMALVVALDGDKMETIDGNTLNPTKGTGGQVWYKPNKKLSSMHSMYSPARDSTFP